MGLIDFVYYLNVGDRGNKILGWGGGQARKGQ